MFQKILILIVGLLVTINACSQNNVEHDHEHHHGNEIGLSVSPVYFINAEEISLAAHLHYVYNFPHTKFGLGFGYERVFDDHKHNFIGIEGNYRPINKLTLNISPGIAFEGEHKSEKEFALHFETVYEFELGAFHLGPVLEFAWHPEDIHISLGVHFGLGL
jgi:hypothetical protein